MVQPFSMPFCSASTGFGNPSGALATARYRRETDGHRRRLGVNPRAAAPAEQVPALAASLGKAVARKAGLGGVPAEQDRGQQLDPGSGGPAPPAPRKGPRPEER